MQITSHAGAAGKIVILDAVRQGLEQEIHEALPEDWNFYVSQLNTGKAGAFAVDNSLKPEKVVVAIGDVRLSEGQKAILAKTLARKRAHVIHFQPAMPAEQIAALVQECVRKNIRYFHQ